MLEKMSDFFASRVVGYDQHMLNKVAGCKEGYQKMAELLPETVVDLLDLGCGTGLELDAIFKIHPHLKVTGVDLTQAMLEVLQKKHLDKDLTLINASYFDYDFGKERYDAVISFQTMHHFPPDQKIQLYSRVCAALRPGGKYLECDYMVLDQTDEDFYLRENQRLRKEENIAADELYHYDIPCTVNHQLQMLRAAQFEKAAMVWRLENTTIIVADKALK